MHTDRPKTEQQLRYRTTAQLRTVYKERRVKTNWTSFAYHLAHNYVSRSIKSV